MAQLAWDAFTTNGDLGGRLAEDGIHTWTERPTLPINGSFSFPVFEAPVTSQMATLDSRAVSVQGTGKAPLATVNVGTADVDVTADVETIGPQGEGAMLIGRWTTNSVVAAVFYRAISGSTWSFFARRYTVSPFAVEDYVVVNLGTGWGPWYTKLRMVVIGATWRFYIKEGMTTNTPPPARTWVELGSHVDTSGVTSTHHGLGLYFASPFVGGGLPGFAVDNWAANDPDLGVTWEVDLLA